MEIFNFIFNVIIGFFELLAQVPIVNGFNALDFILCCLLFSIAFSVFSKRRSD